ncbi:ABC transporter permease subunit [Klebsiella grimontii]|uniref:ABC transporter permease subunit n=1 Tax=Klebsiella grimontii TaxID=2058152 RepID=UPI00351AD11B
MVLALASACWVWRRLLSGSGAAVCDARLLASPRPPPPQPSAANDYRGVPTPVLILTALLLAGMFMATRTAFGRRIYAIGGNLEAARLSGISVERTKLAVFAINGLMVAIAGLILSSRLGAGSPSAGNIAELDAIAACVIGGTSLAGGIGSVAGAVMGAFIMSALDNGMSMMDVATFWQYIVKGVILLLAVWMDSATKRRN